MGTSDTRGFRCFLGGYINPGLQRAFHGYRFLPHVVCLDFTFTIRFNEIPSFIC
jgi:hypothetical protein